MNKKHYCILLFFLAVTNVAFSQSYKPTKLGIMAELPTMNVELQYFSPQIVRILKYPKGTNFRNESLSVIKTPQKTPLKVNRSNDVAIVKSNAVEVRLDLKTGKVSFFSPDGKPLLTEKENSAAFTPVKDNVEGNFAMKQVYSLDEKEVIYGLGQQPNGKLNQRGQKIFLKNENTRVAIPFIQSVKGYGLFWDNPSLSTFEDGPTGTSFESQVGKGINYYFLAGGGSDGVVTLMRDLTGQAPMMPLWVYGFSQSRERYKTQFEIVDVVRKYRDLKIPLDGIVQDWQYWGADSNWNAMSFAPKIYPRPQAMVDTIHNLNAHLFIVAWPGFAPKTPQYQEFKRKDMLINFDTWPPGANTRPYDVYNPEARNIYWSYLNKGIFSLGIDAWWLDSTEPDHINLKEQDFDQPTHLGTFRSVHNAFPLSHTKGVYENQRKTSEEKRVVLLTRSAFAGQQRYSANTWSGDIGSDWPTFVKQIPNAINFSLSGLPYWNADIGGFFAGAYVKNGGVKNPEFQELYTRWMQFATFTPMMRSHGTDLPREIYQFGNRGDKIFDVQEKFIKLRYSLLPYTYSTAWNVTKNSGSIIRPLYAVAPTDAQGLENTIEYLYGDAFLVAPVTEKGATKKQVYLPAGIDWVDFWTGEQKKGGQTVEKSAPIDIIPLYVRAGSIVPWGPDVQYATEKKWDNLEIRIYPGANGMFKLYEDEFDNYNYEKGAYTEITFRWNDKTKVLSIDDRKGKFKNMLMSRKFNMVIVNGKSVMDTSGSSAERKSITYTGKRTSLTF
ncbi:TIM-barrel domain-containing protein [Pedobacter sp. Leaf194]|uniref:glycoside hydrolase family 31 protein n=1 Tax=Pedobacter sp. Leaf194 TaxID=1736297 RepID=UPI0007036C35|nr:TIM-barrel domain-containing protein [Pedobacter sp. Leaf194]KQS41820.1 xylosidase [Pedobacter sp. Leaf194]